MRLIVSFLLVVSIFFSFGLGNVYGATNSIFKNSTNEIPYCNDGECGLKEGVEAVRDIDVIERDRTASRYVQDVVQYVLGFLFLIAVLMIIYAGFNLLTSAGDEEKSKKSKQIILYTIIGIFIIFIAGPLITFVIGILN